MVLGMLVLVVNYAPLFAALWWGLAGDKPAAQCERQDKGGMTADGLPFVPGPAIR